MVYYTVLHIGIGVKQETLLKLFEQHNSEFAKKVGHSRAQGIFQRYKTFYKHLCEFIPNTYKRNDIPLKELNLTFINDFEFFCALKRNVAPIRYGLYDCTETHRFHSVK